MDVASLALSLISLQAGNTQQQVATSVLKSNLDSEQSSVLTLLGAGSPSLANVGAGIGGNLNIAA
jgi:Putative motility protein